MSPAEQAILDEERKISIQIRKREMLALKAIDRRDNWLQQTGKNKEFVNSKCKVATLK